MDNAKIKEIRIRLENMDRTILDGRYIETFHIGEIKHERSIGDYVEIEDFWLKMNPEGNTAFKKPELDPDDPSSREYKYMEDITKHKYEVLNSHGMVNELDIRYADGDGQQERTDHYCVYWEDWSDDELDNLIFNPCQHTYIDEDGRLYMVISKEHSLADVFPESLRDKTEIRERRPVWAADRGIKRFREADPSPDDWEIQMPEDYSHTPWYQYLRRLDALLDGDDDVETGNYSVTDNVVCIEILCHDITKFQALKEVLKNNVVVGDTRICLDFIFDGSTSDDYDETFRKAFSGNRYFKEIVKNKEHKGCAYAAFKEYFSDDTEASRGIGHEHVADIVTEVTNLIDSDGFGIRIIPCSEE